MQTIDKPINAELAKIRNRADDRVIVLKVADGLNAKASNGLVDPRLFKGGNALHAIMGPTGLWYCKFEEGVLPEILKQQFTSFNKLVKVVRDYYKGRNIEVTEVRD